MNQCYFLKARLVLYWLAFLFLPLSVSAQSAAELDTRLANGRLLLDQQKYELAMAEFVPVVNAPKNYRNLPEALYFYSVAALNAKRVREAGGRIDQLLQQFPSWENLDEARYVGAAIAFEQKDYAKALALLNDIKAKEFDDDKAKIKGLYLPRIIEKEAFTRLYQQNPDDRELATAYADKLAGGWYTEADKETLENIVSKFKLDKKKYSGKALASGRKTQYNVAVLLPFGLNEPNSAQALRKNQFVTDLYAGMQMAKDSLARNNINLNLFSYDAPADTNQVKKVLSLPEMANMDLIIGPVYKSANKIISRFAQQHQIIAVNPLSDDISLIRNNPYLYLFQPSIATQARKSANFAYDNFGPNGAVIIYSNTEDGMEYARVYRAEFEKRGGKVLLSKAVSPSSTASGLYSGVDFTKVGHLMIASNSMPVAVNTMSTLERLPGKIPVITFASWLDISQMSLDQLDNQEIYFLNPKFVDTSLPAVREFKKDYKARYHIPPSVYAYTGFDLLYYFGNILARHGSHFNSTLAAEGPISGAFFQGIGYNAERDNQYIPFLKLDNLQINVVNPVFK
ncbi:ABC transporter substrate-binding protein [Adhaeribacter aerolatus]|nr:ABC transporter substrate-binding protein [Adhaeribacter aerolatus]